MNVKIDEVNNLSDQLKEIVKKAMPKRGQAVFFRSLKPNSRGTSVLSMDTIYDPWGGKDGKGGQVNIAYITGVASPKELGEKPSPVLGRIQFRKKEGGNTIQIRGGNISDETLFEYLFLTNQNVLCRNNTYLNIYGIPEDNNWYIANSKGPAFTMDLPKKKAEDILEFERDYRDATRIIDEMPDDHLRMFAIGLDLTGIPKGADPDEIRASMITQVAKKNPRTIIHLHTNEKVRARILIDKAQRKGVIKKLQSGWVKESTDAMICPVMPGENPDEVFRDFLVSPKGAEFKEWLEDICADQRKERSAGRPKGAKNKSKKETAEV